MENGYHIKEKKRMKDVCNNKYSKICLHGNCYEELS